MRVFDRVGEDRGAQFAPGGPGQNALKALTKENVIAQDQGHVVAANELPADQKGLGQTGRGWLHGIADRNAQLIAVAQQALEAADVLGRRDQQNVANAGQHQRRQRIVDHRLVVHRQQLLADGARQRIQPRAGAAGQDDPFIEIRAGHCRVVSVRQLNSGNDWRHIQFRVCHCLLAKQCELLKCTANELAVAPKIRPAQRF